MQFVFFLSKSIKNRVGKSPTRSVRSLLKVTVQQTLQTLAGGEQIKKEDRTCVLSSLFSFSSPQKTVTAAAHERSIAVFL